MDAIWFFQRFTAVLCSLPREGLPGDASRGLSGLSRGFRSSPDPFRILFVALGPLRGARAAFPNPRAPPRAPLLAIFTGALRGFSDTSQKPFERFPGLSQAVLGDQGTELGQVPQPEIIKNSRVSASVRIVASYDPATDPAMKTNEKTTHQRHPATSSKLFRSPRLALLGTAGVWHAVGALSAKRVKLRSCSATRGWTRGVKKMDNIFAKRFSWDGVTGCSSVTSETNMKT